MSNTDKAIKFFIHDANKRTFDKYQYYYILKVHLLVR
jgi:hypothetical protein